jgi:hypothetical protein
MAGTAGANHTTIMMKFDIVLQSYLQNALVGSNIFKRYRLQAFLLECKFDSVHEML